MSAIVKQWLVEPPPAEVQAAIRKLAQAPDVCHVAVMPDVHLATPFCVGLAIATTRLIYPDAVGGDIGCGIAACRLTGAADVLSSADNAAAILSQLYERVPFRRHRRRVLMPLPEALAAHALTAPALEQAKAREAALQLGTLGSGNHFLELQADENDQLSVMVHSGSRGMGQAVRAAHTAGRRHASGGLSALDATDDCGRAYLADMQWARDYAAANRRRMVEAVGAAFQKLFNIGLDESAYLDCDHNHVAHEVHAGHGLWVHRKGANAAAAGQPGIIPGSMATESYYVIGQGFPDALGSSSHGAGRLLGRHEARRRLSARDVLRQMGGVWFDHRQTDYLREEAPGAYKNIQQVMRAQHALTRITRRLRPLLTQPSQNYP